MTLRSTRVARSSTSTRSFRIPSLEPRVNYSGEIFTFGTRSGLYADWVDPYKSWGLVQDLYRIRPHVRYLSRTLECALES